MSKKLIVVLIIAGVLIAGFAFLWGQKNTAKVEQQPKPADQHTSSASSTQQSASQSAAAGAYTSYSADAVANTKGKRILFFHAPWCPQCRLLDASITAGPIPSGVTIFKVDYDSNQKLRQDYGVTIQTTLILLDDNGGEAKKYVAYDTPSLAAILEHLL